MVRRFWLRGARTLSAWMRVNTPRDVFIFHTAVERTDPVFIFALQTEGLAVRPSRQFSHTALLTHASAVLSRLVPPPIPGRYEAQEEQLVEGDLFGSTHVRASSRSTDQTGCARYRSAKDASYVLFYPATIG